MKKRQQGFSLIELMIVVAIIGVLSAVAVPAYNNYKVKATMADGLSLASSAKFGLVEYRNENGDWPTSAQKALGAATPTATVANSGSGKITVTYAAAAGTTLSGKKLTLSANEVGGIIQWDCLSDADTTAAIHPKGCAYSATP